MNALRNDAELREALTKRDASAGDHEDRFTDPSDYITDLKADYELGVITDNFVRLSRGNGVTTIQEVVGRWVPGGDRPHHDWRSKYVESSYVARGRLLKLSAYCGVAYVGKATPPGWAREVSEATAQRLHQTTRKVQVAIDSLKGIERRGGSIAVADGDWTAFPGHDIEPVPELTCVHCGVAIHWSNGHWRDEAGKYDVLVDAHGRNGGTVKKLDHEHGPELPE